MSADGTLFADVWNYQPNLDLNADMSYSLYAWNAPKLIQGALNAYQRDPVHAYPIDRDLPADPHSPLAPPQIPDLTPIRYDDSGDGSLFAGMMNLGSYQTWGSDPVFGQVDVPLPAIKVVPKEPPVPLTAGLEGDYAVLGYVLGGIDLLTGGYIGRADVRQQKYNAGELKYDQMAVENIIDLAATSGAFLVSGGVATGVTIKLTAKGYNAFLAMSGAGAAMGATFDMVEQAGANIIYLASDGADGHKGLNVESLAWATAGGAALGGGFAVAGKAFGWLAGKVLPKAAARVAEARSGSLGHENLPEIKGKTEVRVGDSLKFTTPSAQSMTLMEAENWLQAEMAKLGTMIDSKLPLKLQVEEAYALKEQLIAGAKAALKATEDGALFGERWHSTTPLDRLKSELSKDFSGDAFYKQLLKKITTLENAERVVTLEDGIKAIARTDLEGACFYGETKVAVEGMGLVEIQFVGPGMRVLSRCEETGETAYRDVIQQFCRDAPTYHVYCAEGDIGHQPIETTAEHPFWVKGKGWTPVIELQKGDVLENSRGAETIVWEVEPTKFTTTVYNLEVEGFNTYFVGESGLWVHNCNMKDTGAKVWELVKKDDATTRVLDTLVERKSLTPNRADLEAKLNDPKIPDETKKNFRAQLGELDCAEALSKAGMERGNQGVSLALFPAIKRVSRILCK